jgi:alkylation response protein AidB-like acyl-CoA dehydrogenase
VETVTSYLPVRRDLVCGPFLGLIAAQAGEADLKRSVSPDVIAAIKGSDLIRYSAARAIGGVEGSVLGAGEELEAIAGACASTAWCLWNHLCVFHHYGTLFGTEARDTLAGIVEAREWVTYPNGAGTGVTGTPEGESWVLDGTITFASGARYGEWALVMFSHDSPGDDGPAVSHTLVRLDAPGVEIVPTWDGMAVRASATDDVKLSAVRTPASLGRRFYADYAVRARAAEWPVVDDRYREDWAGISSLWLAAQATGLARAALEDAVSQAAARRAIAGVPMAQRPAVQLNLGEAAALIASARATWTLGCTETDARIAGGRIPDDAAQLRQFGYAMTSIRQTGAAMQLLVRVLGGNGQRESGTFERRWRDYQAMGVHIICHPDRVNEMTGKWLLGVKP